MLTGLAAALISASPLCGDIVFHEGPGAVQPAERVQMYEPSLLNAGGLVQGITNQSNHLINFSSNEAVVSPVRGTWRVEARDGQYESLEISLDQLVPFTELEFNVRIPNNLRGTQTLSLVAYDTAGRAYVSSKFELGNGSNFFGIQAIDGRRIERVVLTASDEVIAHLSHVGVTAIPEPSLALLIGAMGISAGCLVRRKRRDP
jgi:hypothetical protein